MTTPPPYDPQQQPQYPSPGQYPAPAAQPGQYPPAQPGYPAPGQYAPGYQPYPPAPYAPAKGPVSGAVPGIGWAIVGASVLVIIAAFLVWVKVGPFEVKGIGGSNLPGGDDDAKDGTVTLTLAVAALILGILRGTKKAALGAAIVALVMGAIVMLVALADIGDTSDLKDRAKGSGVDVSVGIGLWLTLIGGIALVVLGIVGIVKRR